MPVKLADIPCERYSPTEPVSVGMPQTGAQRLTEADMWGATLGGTLATQGGLVFITGTQDYYLRAFDSATGKQYLLITAGCVRQSPDRGNYVTPMPCRMAGEYGSPQFSNGI